MRRCSSVCSLFLSIGPRSAAHPGPCHLGVEPTGFPLLSPRLPLWPRGQAKQELFPVTLCSSISCQTVLSGILTCWDELIITEGTGGGVELLLMTRRDSGRGANDGHSTVLTWTPMSHPQPPCLEVPAPQVQLGLTSTSWLSSISLGTEIFPRWGHTGALF